MKLFTVSLTVTLALLSSIGMAGRTVPTPGSLIQVPDSLGGDRMDTLSNSSLVAKSAGRSLQRVTDTRIIGQAELVRAACCNLGESFTTNPSVDVTYSDASTGARQIKLLGLNGTYVQMLTENIPNLRGAGIPYSLSYVPGPWMQSIQVSKGASSVKNGFESTTGQINVEYLKPQGMDGVRANAYFDSDLKQEVNLDGSIHLTDRLSTSALLHFENRQSEHDRNGDNFMDMPRLRQYNGMWRMAYVSPVWISQLSLKALHDGRVSGMSRHGGMETEVPHYGMEVTTDRYELHWKNGFTLDPEHNTSVALMLHGSIHDAGNSIGKTVYDVTQKNGYAQLMFETDFTPEHNLSAGASVNHDSYRQGLDLFNSFVGEKENLFGAPEETTAGLYAQYTYKAGDRLTVMPGVRWDHSSEYGGFWTPRIHIRYVPWEPLTLRASAGKGYRSPHVLAENVSVLSSGKTFIARERLGQEEAWNAGISASLGIPVAGKDLEINVDYYYTDFLNQTVINPDGAEGANTFTFADLSGRSRTHSAQIDATYPFFSGFTATGAFRYTDARTTYDGELRLRPLTPRFKGMLTVGYKTPLELWQFDITGSLNGPGELYDHSRYPAYFQLQAQITREFRWFSVYIGGENLTDYRIPNPILGSSDPWSPSFDATQIWGPVTGAMGYIGISIKLENLGI